MATGHHEQLKAFLRKVAALSDTELDTIASAIYPKSCRRCDVLLASGDNGIYTGEEAGILGSNFSL